MEDFLAKNGFPGELPFRLPNSFFDRIIRDIPASGWVSLIHEEPILKESLLKGFSSSITKLAHLVRQPQVEVRLRRMLQNDPDLLKIVLGIWALEQSDVIDFIEMLDGSFLLDNFEALRDLLGPARFLACLYVLDYWNDTEFSSLLEEGFWDRSVERDTLEVLNPAWTVLEKLIEEFQDLPWLHEALAGPEGDDTIQPKMSQEASPQTLHREQERRKKVEIKLKKLQAEKERIKGDLTRYREENEDLRSRVATWEKEFESRLEKELAHQRRQWFQRYHASGVMKDATLEKAYKRFDGLLKRVDQAFELQRQADEQYGLISAVSQQLLHVELYLKEVERIYRDSLVVHSEVAQVKDALLHERKRLLNLPEIQKVFGQEPDLRPGAGLKQKLRFLEPVPENLSRIVNLEELANSLESLNLLEEAETVRREIQQKKSQVCEVLYHRFQPDKKKDAEPISYQNLDDFVESGESKKYDIYVDGYNVLLKVQGGKNGISDASLRALREEFTAGVLRKRHFFHKIFLVFDGVKESREAQGNVEIIFSDRTRGISADTIIIRALGSRKDSKSVLVTADQEIIHQTERRVHASVDPFHFYMFVFDLSFPVPLP